MIEHVWILIKLKYKYIIFVSRVILSRVVVKRKFPRSPPNRQFTKVLNATLVGIKGRSIEIHRSGMLAARSTISSYLFDERWKNGRHVVCLRSSSRTCRPTSVSHTSMHFALRHTLYNLTHCEELLEISLWNEF